MYTDALDFTRTDDMRPSSQLVDRQFQLWFRPLSISAPALAFTCDATGHVDLDSLDQRERLNYLFARTLVGRDFDRPTVASMLDALKTPERLEKLKRERIDTVAVEPADP